MKTEVERLEEKDTVLLRVEVPTDVFGKAVDDTYKRISQQLVVPGFRKGKIPKAVIDSRVGRESVRQEALQRALPNYYVDAVRKSEIEPVDQPEVDIIQVGDGKPLIFTAKVRVKPEVKLGEYKGINLEKASSEPTEQEIEKQINSLRDSFASLEPVDNRPIREGDFALINFEGFIDDKPFEGGSANDYLLEIGSGTFIPGFEEQLVGMKKGEAKDITVTFPQDYGNEELAGKEARFRVLLKEIKEKHLQELNDDFAKQVGFDTVDELKADIANKIREVKKKYADTELKNQAISKVTEAAELEVPESMVEHELEDMIEEFSADVKRQGLTLEKYLELTGMDISKLREDWREQAEYRVKSRLVLEAVAKAENIEVTPEEVDNEIKKAAEATGRDYEEVKQIFLIKGTMGDLKNRLLISKAISWLVDNAVVEVQEETEKETKEKAKADKKKKAQNVENEEELKEEKQEKEEKNPSDEGTE
ncbi:MAG: trigger factor [Firmicutes bacterium]|nr:trigger factor [Bacillota bacterium]